MDFEGYVSYLPYILIKDQQFAGLLILLEVEKRDFNIILNREDDEVLLAKESIFSGLNNLSVASIIGYKFSNKFGFTEKEIEKLLNHYNKSENLDNIKQWYSCNLFFSDLGLLCLLVLLFGI